MLVMGIESSCDETGVAVVEDGRRVVGEMTLSQVAVHAEYGGVVPEIASREHVRGITCTVKAALDDAGLTLDDIDAVAVTQGPGLVGSLLVGLAVAKSIAYVYRLPLIPVHHIEAHLYANFLDSSKPTFPFLGVVTSGGHTCLLECRDHHEFTVIGTTRDDAVGEAFDKVAKLLGLPYPGGVSIEKTAQSGSSTAITFPRPMVGSDTLDMSFSGLKTAVLYHVRDNSANGEPLSDIADVAAGFQAAAIDVIVSKTRDALDRTGFERVVLAGGVAANKLLRDRFRTDLGLNEKDVHVPPLKWCMDNGAMVATAGFYIYGTGCVGDLMTNADPNLPLGIV
ncbi:MAG: tRNA (adenosine(37)-N6)-threonylcarbamoyltransferase complex transferase subunit TsaD [Candidatus Hydrogenedentes bacterium]|nr:tRNA (adenosine(37)-N6)-threonylcarbamoyltransferase complex transferase subunit TsaD [Candidatus Hydrogenedentota bacterium]